MKTRTTRTNTLKRKQQTAPANPNLLRLRAHPSVLHPIAPVTISSSLRKSAFAAESSIISLFTVDFSLERRKTIPKTKEATRIS